MENNNKIWPAIAGGVVVGLFLYNTLIPFIWENIPFLFCLVMAVVENDEILSTVIAILISGLVFIYIKKKKGDSLSSSNSQPKDY